MAIISPSERVYKERMMLKKKSLLESMAESGLLAQRLKALARGNYIQTPPEMRFKKARKAQKAKPGAAYKTPGLNIRGRTKIRTVYRPGRGEMLKTYALRPMGLASPLRLKATRGGQIIGFDRQLGGRGRSGSIVGGVINRRGII